MIRLVALIVITLVGCGKEYTELQQPEPINPSLPLTTQEITCYSQKHYQNGSLLCIEENVWKELPLAHCPLNGYARVCVYHRRGTFCLTHSMGRQYTMRYSPKCSI